MIIEDAKPEKSEDYANIDEYRVAANVTEYHIIKNHHFIIHDDKAKINALIIEKRAIHHTRM